MKKSIFNLIIIAISIVLLQSCKKEVLYDGGFGLTPTYVLNKYILTDMKAEISSSNDTCKYSDVGIKLDFKGLLVSEDVEHSGLLGVDPTVHETPYFINVIKDMEIYSNNNSYRFRLYTHTEADEYYDPFIIGGELGYSPKYLFLSNPPDTSDYYYFTIKITDVYDNQFVATTDSVYITK
jgi:hypothetical protein